MGSHSNFLIETTTISENSDAFLRHSGVNALRTESYAYLPMFGRSTMSSHAYNGKAALEHGQLVFSTPWFSNQTPVNGHIANPAGDKILGRQGVFENNLFAADRFNLDVSAENPNASHSVTGTYKRGLFVDEADTVTTDYTGNVILSSHSVISPGFFARTIDTDFRDANGKKIGDARNTIYQTGSLGRGLEYCGLAATLGGIGCLGFRMWKPGVIATAVGLGLLYGGANIPRVYVSSEYRRFAQ